MKRLNNAIFGIGTALMLILSCGGPKEIARHNVHPEDITPETIVKKNQANAGKLKFMKATAMVQVQSPVSGNQFGLQIALKLPDSAYIKIEGILGIDGLKASLNRETYVVYNIMNKTVSLGSTSPRAIRKTFDMDVSFDDMMGLLLGLPKIQKNDLDSLAEFSAEESYYVMTIHRHDHKQKIWFDPFAEYAISKIVDFDSSGEIYMEREFTRFYKEGDVWFPRYVRLTRPKKQDLLSLYFEERQLDKSFSSSLFIIRYPKDAEILKN